MQASLFSAVVRHGTAGDFAPVTFVDGGMFLHYFQHTQIKPRRAMINLSEELQVNSKSKSCVSIFLS